MNDAISSLGPLKSIGSRGTLIIAAISSRAYVQAAVEAGFEVIAIDAFCDVETQLLAKQTLQVPAPDGIFNADAFNKAMASIHFGDVLGVAIGAGFEVLPNLLLTIAKPIFNAPSRIESVKNPHTFFDFLQSMNAPYPPTQLLKPKQSTGWLQKQIGGSGGAHIKALLPIDVAQKYPVYYQRQCNGEPYGCLFLADGAHVQIIGFHAQWCAPTSMLPYRFGGAVSHIHLSIKIKDTIEDYIKKISQHFGLCGINSLDFLVENDDINLLEINPRLSASLQLYSAKKGNIFAAHVQACLGLPVNWPVIDNESRAMQVIYANKPADVPPDMDWPDWVCDIPQANSHIPAGAPLCTVLVTARTAKLARQKVLQRACEL